METKAIMEAPVVEITTAKSQLRLYHDDLADAKVGDTWTCDASYFDGSQHDAEILLKVVFVDDTGLAILEQGFEGEEENILPSLQWVSLHRKRKLDAGLHRRRPPQK